MRFTTAVAGRFRRGSTILWNDGGFQARHPRAPVRPGSCGCAPRAGRCTGYLYQVQLTQQEDQSRDQALREATVVMLQRLAGQNVDLKHQAIANALKSPQE